MTHKVVALLPMKANSERVRGKNFKNFCGKPLFKWVLDTLLSVERIDRVIINTDARNILLSHGVTESPKLLIRDRTADICGDAVSMNRVIRSDVESVESDIYVMTHTTNPLLSAGSIVTALSMFEDLLREGSNDSLFSVDEVQERFYTTDAVPVNHDPTKLLRTQDLAPWYRENSNLYLFTRESFFSANARIGLRPKMLVTNRYESTDIDTPSDWDFAEALVAYYRSKGVTAVE